MHPSKVLAVTLAAHEAQLAIIAGSAWSSAEANPKPPSRIGMKSCFACANVRSPTPRMGLVNLTNHSRGLGFPCFACANSHQNQLRLGVVFVQCGLGVRSR